MTNPATKDTPTPPITGWLTPTPNSVAYAMQTLVPLGKHAHTWLMRSALFDQRALFIVDHPAWDDDHPLRERNIRDQATFDELIREAERYIRSNPVGGASLSRLIS